MSRPRLRRVEHNGELPLSLEQEEIWHTWPIPPDSIAYHHPLVLWVDGPFNRTAWDRAVARVVARHDALRTRFPAGLAGGPRQRIDEPFTPDIGWHDLRSAPPEEREQAWEQLVRTCLERPFDLAGGPLLRGVAARIEEGLHGIVLVFHRAVLDCWASGIVERELAALYEDPPTALDEPAVQYPDYTVWQHSWWNAAYGQRLLDHWRAELDGARPFELPVDRPRPEAFDVTGDIVRWRLEPPAAAAVIELARAAGTSPFVVLGAAYALLLARWTGRSDVLVAATLGGRTLARLSTVVGLFANTVLLRSDVHAEPTFRSLLATTRRRVITAFAHQDTPFGRVVADHAPGDKPGPSSLTTALLSHQEFVDPATLTPRPPGPLRAGYRDVQGAMREAKRRAERSTFYDLELHTIVNRGMVAGLFEYRTGCFEHDTIERLARGFETLLGRVASDPDAPLDS